MDYRIWLGFENEVGEIGSVEFELEELRFKLDAGLELVDGKDLGIGLALELSDEVAASPRGRTGDKDSPHTPTSLPIGRGDNSSSPDHAPTMAAYFGATK